MAQALNRQYISKIRNLVNSIPPTGTNPLTLYKKVIGDKSNTFTFKKINYSQLLKEVSKMKPTASEGQDNIPMKAIKAAITELAPLILLLVNSTIKTKTFPIQLKTTKIIPIRKPEKDKTSSDGWRPINIVQALSKIIERVYLRQILEHIQINNLVNHSHHGGLRGKSTQSILTEVHDNLVETLEAGEDAALVLVDQSKAFNIIDHDILIGKLKIIGFTNQAIQIIQDYLSDRRQYVSIQNAKSDCLVTGPRSVVQGSTLSGVLYLIYILDLPYLTHEEIHDPESYRKCQNPNIKTFRGRLYGKNKK